MQSQRIEMSPEQYHLLPRKPGWKCEYFDGMAHIQPWHDVVTLILPIAHRSAPCSFPLRQVARADTPALVAAFYTAFRDTCEYCDWSDKAIHESSLKSIETFFSGQRGALHPASCLAAKPSTPDKSEVILGAALIVRNAEGPCLDLLFVRPHWQRHGLATALVTAAVNALYEQGEQTLQSACDLANETSIAWHHRFGFVEEPDLHLAETYAMCARHALWRREQMGDLNAEERISLEQERAYWETQVERLRAIADRDGYEAVTPLLRRHRH